MHLAKLLTSSTISGLALLAGTMLFPTVAGAAISYLPPVNGQPPVGAFRDGVDSNGGDLYACMAPYINNSLQPGKYVYYNGIGGCHFGYGGKEIRVTQGVLFPVADDGFTWNYDPATSGFSPNAVGPLGRDSDSSILQFCVAFFNSSAQPGKTTYHNAVKGCNFGYGGREMREENPNAYEYIDVIPSSSVR